MGRAVSGASLGVTRGGYIRFGLGGTRDHGDHSSGQFLTARVLGWGRADMGALPFGCVCVCRDALSAVWGGAFFFGGLATGDILPVSQSQLEWSTRLRDSWGGGI